MRPSPEQHVDPPFCEPTRKQQAFLARHNLAAHPMDFHEAAGTISRFVRSCRDLSPTRRQERFLKQRGLWRAGMSRGEAFDCISAALDRT